MLRKKLCLHGTINIALCAVRCLVLAVLVRNVYKVHDPNYYRNEATKSPSGVCSVRSFSKYPTLDVK